MMASLFFHLRSCAHDNNVKAVILTGLPLNLSQNLKPLCISDAQQAHPLATAAGSDPYYCAGVNLSSAFTLQAQSR
jgi:hypothetical protein